MFDVQKLIVLAIQNWQNITTGKCAKGVIDIEVKCAWLKGQQTLT